MHRQFASNANMDGEYRHPNRRQATSTQSAGHTKQIYCDLCNVRFTEQQQYFDHISGALHQRNREKMNRAGQSRSTATSDPLLKSCKACGNLAFETSNEWLAHIESRPHCENVLKIYYSVGEAFFAQHHGGGNLAFSTEIDKQCSEAERSDLDTIMRLRSGLLYDFMCKLCVVKLTTKANWTEHVTGRKHNRRGEDAMRILGKEQYLEKYGDVPMNQPINQQPDLTQRSNIQHDHWPATNLKPSQNTMYQEQHVQHATGPSYSQQEYSVMKPSISENLMYQEQKVVQHATQRSPNLQQDYPVTTPIPSESNLQQQKQHQQHQAQDIFVCECCDDRMASRTAWSNHLNSLTHCRKVLSLFFSLGDADFYMRYASPPFSFNIDAQCTMQDNADPYQLMCIRSGLLYRFKCTLCGKDCHTRANWIDHVSGKKHARKFMEMIVQIGYDEYTNVFGDMPRPHGDKLVAIVNQLADDVVNNIRNHMHIDILNGAINILKQASQLPLDFPLACPPPKRQTADPLSQRENEVLPLPQPPQQSRYQGVSMVPTPKTPVLQPETSLSHAENGATTNIVQALRSNKNSLSGLGGLQFDQPYPSNTKYQTQVLQLEPSLSHTVSGATANTVRSLESTPNKNPLSALDGLPPEQSYPCYKKLGFVPGYRDLQRFMLLYGNKEESQQQGETPRSHSNQVSMQPTHNRNASSIAPLQTQMPSSSPSNADEVYGNSHNPIGQIKADHRHPRDIDDRYSDSRLLSGVDLFPSSVAKKDPHLSDPIFNEPNFRQADSPNPADDRSMRWRDYSREQSMHQRNEMSRSPLRYNNTAATGRDSRTSRDQISRERDRRHRSGYRDPPGKYGSQTLTADIDLRQEKRGSNEEVKQIDRSRPHYLSSSRDSNGASTKRDHHGSTSKQLRSDSDNRGRSQSPRDRERRLHSHKDRYRSHRERSYDGSSNKSYERSRQRSPLERSRQRSPLQRSRRRSPFDRSRQSSPLERSRQRSPLEKSRERYQDRSRYNERPRNRTRESSYDSEQQWSRNTTRHGERSRRDSRDYEREISNERPHQDERYNSVRSYKHEVDESAYSDFPDLDYPNDVHRPIEKKFLYRDEADLEKYSDASFLGNLNELPRQHETKHDLRYEQLYDETQSERARRDYFENPQIEPVSDFMERLNEPDRDPQEARFNSRERSSSPQDPPSSPEPTRTVTILDPTEKPQPLVPQRINVPVHVAMEIRNPKTKLVCGFPECTIIGQNKPREHLFRNHIPQWCRETDSVDEMMYWAYLFRFIMDAIGVNTIQELHQHILKNGWFPVNRTWDDIAQKEGTVSTALVQRFAQYLGIPVPTEFAETNPKSPAMLIHWRILRCIMQFGLHKDVRKRMKKLKKPQDVMPDKLQ